MATYTSNTNRGYYTQLILSYGAYDVLNNRTPVSYEYRLRSGQYYAFGAYRSISYLDLNVARVFEHKVTDAQLSIGLNGSLLLASGSIWITHNPDGTKSLPYANSFETNVKDGYTPQVALVASGYMDLPAIPRASTITTFNPFTIGSNIAWVVDRKYAAYVHRVELIVADTVIATMDSTGISGTLGITLAMKNQMLGLTPNATSINAILRVTTFTNTNYNTQVGTPQTKAVTASVGEDIVPNFTTVTHSEAVSDVNTKVGKYVQAKSKLNLAITGAAAGQGASIKSYYIEVAGQFLNAVSGVTQEINASGDLHIIAKVIDTRNREISKTVTINVLPYFAPRIENLSGYRCESDGTLTDYGTYLKVKGKITVSSLLSEMIEKNHLQYIIQTKQQPNGSWTEKTNETRTEMIFEFEHILATYSVDYSYAFMLQALDVFGIASIAPGVIAIGKVTMQWGDDWISVGKLATQSELDAGYKLIVGGKAKFDDSIIDKNGNEVLGGLTFTVIKEWEE